VSSETLDVSRIRTSNRRLFQLEVIVRGGGVVILDLTGSLEGGWSCGFTCFFGSACGNGFDGGCGFGRAWVCSCD